MRIHIYSPRIPPSQGAKGERDAHKANIGISHHVENMSQSQYLFKICGQVLKCNWFQRNFDIDGDYRFWKTNCRKRNSENLFWLYNSNTNQGYLLKFLPIFCLVTIWHDDGCVSLAVSGLFMFSSIPLL